MTKLLVAAAAAALVLSPLPALAQDAPSAESCSAWLKKLDTNGDGSLGQAEESEKYNEMITKAGTTGMGEDLVLKGETFLDACSKGTLGTPSM